MDNQAITKLDTAKFMDLFNDISGNWNLMPVSADELMFNIRNMSVGLTEPKCVIIRQDLVRLYCQMLKSYKSNAIDSQMAISHIRDIRILKDVSKHYINIYKDKRLSNIYVGDLT